MKMASSAYWVSALSYQFDNNLKPVRAPFAHASKPHVQVRGGRTRWRPSGSQNGAVDPAKAVSCPSMAMQTATSHDS